MHDMSSPQVVTLYIHPDNGPVKPITLNLMEIEIAVHNARVPASHFDEQRFMLIAQRIKKDFPDVDPYSNRNALVALLARFTAAYQFSGMVVRLSGTIKDKTITRPAEGAGLLNSEVDKLVKENARLKRLFDIEVQAHQATKEQISKVNADYQRQLYDRDIVYDKNALKIEDLGERLRLREAENKRLREDVEKSVRAFSDLNTQHGFLQDTHQEAIDTHEALKIEYDKLQGHLNSVESDLSKARIDLKNGKRVEEQLRETIETLKDEISLLEEERDSRPRQEPVAQGSDQFDVMLPP